MFIVYAALRAQPAFADSASSITQPKIAFDVVRNHNGQWSGDGFESNANRATSGTILADRITAQSPCEAEYFDLLGYWSTPTLEWEMWQANSENWKLTPVDNDPSRYALRYAPQEGIPAGWLANILVAFKVKDSSLWPNQFQVNAEHSVLFALKCKDGKTELGGDRVLSQLVRLSPNIAYGWGIDQKQFTQYRHENGVDKPIVTVSYTKPLNVYSRDFGTFSTPAGTQGSTGNWCESWIHPDIRTGELRYNIGTCNTSPPGSTGTMFPEYVKSTKLPHSGIWFIVKDNVYTPIEMKPDEDGNLSIRVPRPLDATTPLDIRLPQGQNATLRFQNLIPSNGVYPTEMTFFHRWDGWYYTDKPVEFRENDFIIEGFWKQNHHDIQLANSSVTIASP